MLAALFQIKLRAMALLTFYAAFILCQLKCAISERCLGQFRVVCSQNFLSSEFELELLWIWLLGAVRGVDMLRWRRVQRLVRRDGSSGAWSERIRAASVQQLVDTLRGRHEAPGVAVGANGLVGEVPVRFGETEAGRRRDFARLGPLTFFCYSNVKVFNLVSLALQLTRWLLVEVDST